MYVNMHELANLAANKAQEMLPPPPPPPTTDSDAATTETITTAAKAKTEICSSESNVNCSSEHTISGTTVQRRGSLQQANKPAPPLRRVSSIENSVERNQNDNDLENLPPPPAFLLEGSSLLNANVSPASQRRSISVSETVRTLTELRHTPASPSLLRRNKVATQVHAQVAAQTSNITDDKTVMRSNSNSATSAIAQIACCAMERASMVMR